MIELEEQDLDSVSSCASIPVSARVVAVRRSDHSRNCEVTFRFIDREHRENIKVSAD